MERYSRNQENGLQLAMAVFSAILLFAVWLVLLAWMVMPQFDSAWQRLSVWHNGSEAIGYLFMTYRKWWIVPLSLGCWLVVMPRIYRFRAGRVVSAVLCFVAVVACLLMSYLLVAGPSNALSMTANHMEETGILKEWRKHFVP
jgi:hypothetical protein